MKTYSLRKATLGALLFPLLGAILVATVSALWFSDRAIGLLRDDQMQQEAAFLLLLARHEASEGETLGLIRTVESTELRRVLGARSSFRIWSGNTVVTHSAQETGLPVFVPPEGFSTREFGDHSWRTFAIRQPGTSIIIEVSEPMAMRQAMNGQVVGSLALPLAFLVLAVSVIAYAQATVAMRPMRRMSAEIDARGPDDFRPLSGHRIPEELVPFFSAFNRLLARLGSAVEREREFSDNAAHELRTPLAVLKTRAQIVARDLGGERERRDQVDQLIQATDRATGVIDHLLLLNRLNSGGIAPAPVDLSELVENVCRGQAMIAFEKQQDFGADIEPGIIVPGHFDALAMLLRNIVDNAIRYSPRGGRIDITLGRTTTGDAELRVADTGPGIPEAQRASIFDRFQRLSRIEPGSGLGLAIVRRIIDQHGGSISLADNVPHGLVVRIVLPVAGAD